MRQEVLCLLGAGAGVGVGEVIAYPEQTSLGRPRVVAGEFRVDKGGTLRRLLP